MPSQLQGVYAAAVTPRRLGTQDINLGVMWELIDFLGSQEVQGIVLLGSTGEFVHFSNGERMRMMGLAPKRSKVPVLVNVSHSTFDGAVELAQAAQASGAAGVLLMPPHFFRYSQQDIEEFYRRFADESDIEIPTLLYNIPVFTNPLVCDTAEKLLRDGVVQGIKDSSGDWESFERLQSLRKTTPFTIFVGNDALFARARANGIDGAISGVACAVPELVVALDRAVTAGLTEVVTRLELRLEQFLHRIHNLPTPVGIKEAISLRGLKVGPHAVPPSGLQKKTVHEFRDWFQDWLPVVQNECKHA